MSLLPGMAVAGGPDAPRPEPHRIVVPGGGDDVPVHDSSTGAAVIARLPQGSGPFVPIGREEEGRVPISFGEGPAWVDAAALVPLALPSISGTNLPIGTTCVGNEPFWSVTTGTEGELTYDRLGADGPVTQGGARTASAAAGSLTTIRTAGMTLVVREGLCFDTMSDRAYPWSAALLLTLDGERLHSGCCLLPHRE